MEPLSEEQVRREILSLLEYASKALTFPLEMTAGCASGYGLVGSLADERALLVIRTTGGIEKATYPLTIACSSKGCGLVTVMLERPTAGAIQRACADGRTDVAEAGKGIIN
jgi:hypothetical protein